METGSQNGNGVTERVISGIKVIETEYKVQRPVFEDVKVDRISYVNKQVEVPAGLEKVIIQLAEELASKTLEKCLAIIDAKLEKAIDKRISEIELPKIVYREEYKDIKIDRPFYSDVEVIRPKFVDKEVINPILVDKQVANAVIEDVEVTNAILKDRVIINPVFEDVVIQKPKFVDKEVTAIHIKYVDMKGNPE